MVSFKWTFGKFLNQHVAHNIFLRVLSLSSTLPPIDTFFSGCSTSYKGEND